jgi:DNA-directed RNA polymerase subunit K/omega
MEPKDLCDIPPLLTKYETTRLLGARVQMLSDGTAVDVIHGPFSPIQQARHEIGSGMPHASICRTSTGSTEHLVRVSVPSEKPPSPPGVPPNLEQIIRLRQTEASSTANTQL